MPLVRYELNNEDKLANRELFSAAPKHDSEAMLEGVAMVGLVGVVRQLGNLAEFAADMFHDLHEQVKATAARGHELQLRVQQLERELPLAEKFVLSETNQLRFAYSTVFEWHASIPNYQNHCSEGELPKFIQNNYQECRGPPRLFLLDKFDNGGAGACLKRYSDPSSFKMNWASAQLAKAEKVRQDRKAQRGKKSRAHRSEDVRKTSRDTPRRVRYSSLSSGILYSHFKTQSNPRSNIEDQSEKSVFSALIPESGGPSGKYLSGLYNSSVWPPENFQKLKESLPERNRETLKLSAKDIETEALADELQNVKLTSELKIDLSDSFARTTDVTIEGDQFVDAMTTMESETESELGARQESDSDLVTDARQPEDISLLRHSSENGSLDVQKEDASVHELNDMSEHVLDSVDLVIGSTEGSRSMSPSHSSSYSLNDQPRHLAEDKVLEDSFRQPGQASAKKRASGNAHGTFLSRDLVQTRAQASNILPSKCAYKFTSGNNAKGNNSTGPSLGRSQGRQFSESKGRRTYEQNKAEEAELSDLLMEPGPIQNFPSSSAREPKANINKPVATSGISDNDVISKMAPAPSKSCHTSTLTPGSSDSCAEADIISSPNSSCISIELSPKSPVFSALDSPMSPIRGSRLTASMSGRLVQMEKMRPSSPTWSSDLPSSPSLEATLQSPSPQANWNSTQTLQKPPSSPSLEAALPSLSPQVNRNSTQALQKPPFETSRPLPTPPIPPPLPPPPIHFPVSPPSLGSDPLIESISMYDRSKLRKVHTETPSRLIDERDVLLEQIRTRSFRLRRTNVEKLGTLPRSKEEINVAAILEKANAIRQAFVGSDEEDEDENWNEMQV